MSQEAAPNPADAPDLPARVAKLEIQVANQRKLLRALAYYLEVRWEDLLETAFEDGVEPT